MSANVQSVDESQLSILSKIESENLLSWKFELDADFNRCEQAERKLMMNTRVDP